MFVIYFYRFYVYGVAAYSNMTLTFSHRPIEQRKLHRDQTTIFHVVNVVRAKRRV